MIYDLSIYIYICALFMSKLSIDHAIIVIQYMFSYIIIYKQFKYLEKKQLK
jgi:hypothetical protein